MDLNSCLLCVVGINGHCVVFSRYQESMVGPGSGGVISCNGVVSSLYYADNGSYCLFVYNLPPETYDNSLWQLFGPFGAVQSVKVIIILILILILTSAINIKNIIQ